VTLRIDYLLLTIDNRLFEALGVLLLATEDLAQPRASLLAATKKLKIGSCRSGECFSPPPFFSPPHFLAKAAKSGLRRKTKEGRKFLFEKNLIKYYI